MVWKMFILCLCQRLCLKLGPVVAGSTVPPKVLVVVEEYPILSFGSDSFLCINFTLVQVKDVPFKTFDSTARKHIPLWANIRYIVYDEVPHSSSPSSSSSSS